MSGPATFIADEVLVFELGSYGTYDDCFAYSFHSQTDGQLKSWFVFRNMSAESWPEFFEALE